LLALLEVENLQVHYQGALALEGVTLLVRDGEVVSIIGPNGAGKTSLLRAISGLIRYNGEIRYGGLSLRGLDPSQIVRMGIVHCPERGELFAEMTVQENLELGAFTVKNIREIQNTLNSVYDLFPQLSDRRRQLAGTLSGGERQMLAIGRSLMSKPKLLMLDEPSLGLAPVLRDRIVEAIRQIRANWGISVILVEQDYAVALDVADRVYVLDSGRVVREGPAHMISQDPVIREVYLGVT